MKIKTKILIMPRDGESEVQAELRGYEELKEVQLLHARWIEMKQAFDIDEVDLYLSLEKLFPDFVYLWSLCSPYMLAVFGEKDCFELMELAAKNKSFVWGVDMEVYFEDLPDKVTIYRGGVGSVQDVAAGHSWSLDEGFAAPYACHANGILISAKISKNDILLLGTVESEIVPRKVALKGIKLFTMTE